MRVLYILAVACIFTLSCYSWADDASDKEIAELKQRISALEAKQANQQQQIQSPPAYQYTPPARSSGYIRGPRGGCYTYSASGNKRYVDRSMCN